MDLSTFLNILYDSFNTGESIHNFVINIFGSIIKDKNYNPIEDYENNTIYKIFKGYMNLSARKAKIICNNLDLDGFYDYLSNYSYEQFDVVIEKFKEYNICISESLTFEQLGEIFIALLRNIYTSDIDNLVSKKQLFITSYNKNIIFKNYSFYSAKKKILTINDEHHNYQNNLSNILLNIFFSIAKINTVSLNDISALPKRFVCLYKEYEKLYSQYINIKSAITNLFNDGENEIALIEKETIEYIKLNINNYNSPKKFLSFIKNFKNKLFVKSHLNKISNLLSEQFKTGLLIYVIDKSNINLPFLQGEIIM